VAGNIPALGTKSSHAGSKTFPPWVIVSLGRFHKAKRLKEFFCYLVGRLLKNKGRRLNRKGWLLKIKRHLLKDLTSLPEEVPVYGRFERF